MRESVALAGTILEPDVPMSHLRARLLTLTALAMLAALPSAVAAQSLGPVDGGGLAPTDISRIEVGARAPDFTLAAFGGGTRTLSSYRGKQNVVLVFYRGHWCPWCMQQLKSLKSLLDPELRKDTELLVLAPEGNDEALLTINKIAPGEGPPDFTFLFDPTLAVIDRYGLRNPAGGRRPVPHPATFVIDKQGVVRWRQVDTDYKVRPTNPAILSAVRAAR